MKYFINGAEVSERTFERDLEDNFNAGVDYEYHIDEDEKTAYMDYDDTYGEGE